MRPSGPLFRVVQLCVAGVALGTLVRSTTSPAVYSRDLQEEYLSARALRDGRDVFEPVDALSARYFPVPTDNFRHPNPHPPVLALLALPLTLVSFPVALRCWLAVNLALLIRIGKRLGLSPPASLALAAWPPLWCVLVLGQVEVVILGLLLLAWNAGAEGRDRLAGAAIGVAGVVKFYPLLVLIPYLARGRTRIIGWAALVFGCGQLSNLAVVGAPGLLRYYTAILPGVTAIYARLMINVSPWGALLRLLGGSADVTPLVIAPMLVAPIAVACSLLALRALWRVEPEAAPAGVFVLLPTVWYYYPVLCLPQIVKLLRSGPAAPILLAVAGVSSVVPLVNAALGGGMVGQDGLSAVLGAIQTAGLLGLLALSMPAGAVEACDAARASAT